MLQKTKNRETAERDNRRSWVGVKERKMGMKHLIHSPKSLTHLHGLFGVVYILDPVFPFDNDWEVSHLGDITYITGMEIPLKIFFGKF